MQLNHYNTNFTKQTFPITLVSENVTNAPNIGSLFRIADAFGIEKLILCGEHISLGRKMTRTSRATEKVVGYELQHSALEVVQSLKSKGFYIVSLVVHFDPLNINLMSVRVIFVPIVPIAIGIGRKLYREFFFKTINLILDTNFTHFQS